MPKIVRTKKLFIVLFLGASEAIAPLVESSQERRGGGGDTCFDKFFGTLINKLF